MQIFLTTLNPFPFPLHEIYSCQMRSVAEHSHFYQFSKVSRQKEDSTKKLMVKLRAFVGMSAGGREFSYLVYYALCNIPTEYTQSYEIY